MREKIYQSLIELTNGKWSSFLLKKLSSSKVSRLLIPGYIKVYDIDMKDVSTGSSFSSLHDFFIRELHPAARPIDESELAVVSPVDGMLETSGMIEPGEQFTVKGKRYSVAELLGSTREAAHYVGGTFLVLYLSPANYHRIHSPVNADVHRQYILGTHSYPVNQWGLLYGKSPISGNYRMINDLSLKNGKRCSLIKVGAMFVNSIHLTNPGNNWKKGEEVGYFSFGSTVVLLFEKGAVEIGPVKNGDLVRMGERIANMV